MKSGIYAIINKENGKKYIGSAARGFKKRWNEHLYKLRHNKHNPYLQNAWNKYGSKSFEFIIIEEIENLDILLEREQYWLDFYQSYKRENGYNYCQKAGNTLGLKFSLKEEQKRKGKNHPFFGKSHTEEARKSISEKCKGKNTKINLDQAKEIKKALIEAEYKKGSVSVKIEEIQEKFNFISTRTIGAIRDGKHRLSNDLGGGIKDWVGVGNVIK